MCEYVMEIVTESKVKAALRSLFPPSARSTAPVCTLRPRRWFAIGQRTVRLCVLLHFLHFNGVDQKIPPAVFPEKSPALCTDIGYR